VVSLFAYLRNESRGGGRGEGPSFRGWSGGIPAGAHKKGPFTSSKERGTRGLWVGRGACPFFFPWEKDEIIVTRNTSKRKEPCPYKKEKKRRKERARFSIFPCVASKKKKGHDCVPPTGEGKGGSSLIRRRMLQVCCPRETS